MAKKQKYLYRKAPAFMRSGKDYDFKECSEADKEKIERMFPGCYYFELIETKKPQKPKPTPNMIEGDDEQKEK